VTPGESVRAPEEKRGNLSRMPVCRARSAARAELEIPLTPPYTPEVALHSAQGDGQHRVVAWGRIPGLASMIAPYLPATPPRRGGLAARDGQSPPSPWVRDLPRRVRRLVAAAGGYRPERSLGLFFANRPSRPTQLARTARHWQPSQPGVPGCRSRSPKRPACSSDRPPARADRPAAAPGQRSRPPCPRRPSRPPNPRPGLVVPSPANTARSSEPARNSAPRHHAVAAVALRQRLEHSLGSGRASGTPPSEAATAGEDGRRSFSASTDLRPSPRGRARSHRLAAGKHRRQFRAPASGKVFAQPRLIAAAALPQRILPLPPYPVARQLPVNARPAIGRHRPAQWKCRAGIPAFGHPGHRGRVCSAVMAVAPWAGGCRTRACPAPARVPPLLWSMEQPQAFSLAQPPAPQAGRAGSGGRRPTKVTGRPTSPDRDATRGGPVSRRPADHRRAGVPPASRVVQAPRDRLSRLPGATGRQPAAKCGRLLPQARSPWAKQPLVQNRHRHAPHAGPEPLFDGPGLGDPASRAARAADPASRDPFSAGPRDRPRPRPSVIGEIEAQPFPSQPPAATATCGVARTQILTFLPG